MSIASGCRAGALTRAAGSLFMTLSENFRKVSSLCLRIISTDFYTLYLEGNVYCDGRWHNIRL